MATTDLERLVVQLSADVRSYERSLNKAKGITNKTARDIETRFNRLNKSMSTLGAGLRGAFAGIGAGLASSLTISAIGDLIKQFGNLHDEANKIGVSAEALQELGFAARQNGAEIEDLVTSLGKLQKNVGEARRTGKGPLLEIFTANQKQLSDDVITNLETVADLIANAKTEADRFVIATAAFGKGGTVLIPLLKQGSAAMRSLRQEVRDAGGVLSNELVAKADEFAERWDNAFRVFQVTGAAAALTVIQEIEKLIGVFPPWLIDFLQRGLPKVTGSSGLKLTGGGFPGLIFGPKEEKLIFGGTELEKAQQKFRDLQAEMDKLLSTSTAPIQSEVVALQEKIRLAREEVERLQRAMQGLTLGTIGGSTSATGPGGMFGSGAATPTIIPQGGDGATTFDKAVDKFIKIMVKFESGGNANARNPLSSAGGIAQFIDSTFIEQFRKTFPGLATLSEANILANKFVPEVAIAVARNYAQENGKFLADALKVPLDSVTAAQLQLAHFLGPGGAAAVLKAPAGTPVSQVLSPEQIALNRGVLAGKTTDQVIAEANAREGLAGAIREQSEAFQQLLADNQADIDGMKVRQAELGATTEAQKALAREMELTNQLRQQGINVDDPAVQAIIKDEAARWASAKQSLDSYADSLDAAKEKAKQLAEAQEQAQQTAQQIADAFGGAFKGFISDLAQGKKLTDALRDALINLGQSLLNIALDNLTNSLMGGLGGGLGGGAGLLGGLFHQGGIAGHAGAHRLVPASAFAGAYRYHNGGFAGLRPGEVPAILKRGEPILESMDQLKGLVIAAKRGGMGPGYGGGAIVQNVQFIAPDVKTMARSRNQLARSAGTDLERVRRTL